MKNINLVFSAIGVVAGLAASAHADVVFGVTTNNHLISFDHTNPNLLSLNTPITGLPAGEEIIGFDYRPATNEFVGMSNMDRLYRINSSSGATALIGSGFAPGLTPGVSYGFDINPTVDRLRVVGSDGTNRRLNPVTGASVLIDTPLTYASGGTPRAVGTAYTNSVPGAPLGSVRQFIIDSNLDVLAEVGSMAGGNASFNAGVATIVGPLNAFGTLDVGDLLGFDISGFTGLALLSTVQAGNVFSDLKRIDLNTGQTFFLGVIGSTPGVFARDIAMIPVPGAGVLLGLAGLAAARRRR